MVSGIPSWEESNWSTEKGDEFLVFVVNSRNFWPFLIFILCQISPICSSKPTVCPSHSSFCLGRVPIWIVHMRFFAIWLLPKRKPSQNQREDGEWHQGFWALGSLLRGGLGCLCPVNKDHCPFQGCLFYIVLPPPIPLQLPHLLALCPFRSVSGMCSSAVFTPCGCFTLHLYLCKYMKHYPNLSEPSDFCQDPD